MPDRQTFDPSAETFRLGNSPFYLVAHADFRYHEDMSAVLQKHGVSKPMYRILTVLRETQPASIGAIADAALIKRSTVSRILERMLDRSLVKTQPSEEDNRITEVMLTATGRDTLDMLTPIVNRQFLRATEGLSNAELDDLVKTLQKIGRNLTKSPIE